MATPQNPEQPFYGGMVREQSVRNPDIIAVRAEGLTKLFPGTEQGAPDVVALKNVSLEIASGEIVAIMGPSGAGKSTLLHVLGLMDKATSGTLEIMGRDITQAGHAEMAALRSQKIGFLFQLYHLLPEFTAFENVLLPVMIKGKPDGASVRQAEEILKALGLSQRQHHFPSQLSGGEQQRVALARALINTPQIILADEPTGNLDQTQGEQIRDLLWRTARSRGASLILATHNMELAQKADRIIKIVDGQISAA